MMMELREALLVKKVNDDLIAKEDHHYEERELSADFINRNDFHFYPNDILRNDWQIVPAVPKVLTAEESLRKWHPMLSDIDEDFRNGFLYGLRIGHKNGRLEREKMKNIKNIKFWEAIKHMSPGDIFRPYDSTFSDFIMNENGAFACSTCSNEGELPKAQLLLYGDIIANGFSCGRKSGHQNGRLERDLEFKKCLKEILEGNEMINTLFFWERIDKNLPKL